ncbi:MAG: 7-cyano-7-deazaguanine synthase [Candidatus Peribacteraceae bacterium]|nr:7-cyano-7-deazaguanine synthase [Candidatus Peribacteraceae bacterium]
MEILLFSSGIDSFLADYILTKQGRQFNRVYFNLNGKYNSIELAFLVQLYGFKGYFNVLRHINIEGLEDPETLHVPNRNLLMATAAAGKYNADRIWINGVKDDRAPDQGKEFYAKASEVISLIMGKEVIVDSPLINKEKAEWCKQFVDDGNGVDSLLSNTYSCFSDKVADNSAFKYQGLNGELSKEIYSAGCWACPACFRKACALAYVDIYIPFKNDGLVRTYKDKINRDDHPVRHESIQKYLNFLGEISERI